jgi:hypothetical protein
MAVGGATAYLLAAGLSGLGLYLGYGPLVDVLVPLVVPGGWPSSRCPSRNILVSRWADTLDDRLTARRAIRLVATLPFRVVGAIPIPAIPLIVAVAILGNVIREIGPGGLLAPNGTLSAVIWLGAIVGALVGLARAILAGRTAIGSSGRRVGLVRGGSAAVVLGLIALLVAGSVAVVIGPARRATWCLCPRVDGPTVTQGRPPPRCAAGPGAAGPAYRRTMSYGSGTDRHRTAFDASRAPDPDSGRVEALPRLGAARTRAGWFWGSTGCAAAERAGLVSGRPGRSARHRRHGNHAMGDFEPATTSAAPLAS